MGSIKLLRILHFPLSITLWGAFASHRYELNWGGEWREEEGSHKGITPPPPPIQPNGDALYTAFNKNDKDLISQLFREPLGQGGGGGERVV